MKTIQRLRTHLCNRFRGAIRKRIVLPEDPDEALDKLYRNGRCYMVYTICTLFIISLLLPLVFAILQITSPSDLFWRICVNSSFVAGALVGFLYIVLVFRNYEDESKNNPGFHWVQIRIIVQVNQDGTFGCEYRTFREADTQSQFRHRLRSYAARNMVRNAKIQLGKLPNLKQAKEMPRTAKLSPVSLMTMYLFSMLTLTVESAILSTHWLITLAINLVTLGLFLAGFKIGYFRWADYFVTLPPYDQEIRIEIEREGRNSTSQKPCL